MSSVAKYRNSLEPYGTCSAAESAQLLKRLCPLLKTLGIKTNHPGLLQISAIDNIGGFLNLANPDLYRQKLVTASTDLKVSLRCRVHETLAVEASEALPHAQRTQLVPIRGTSEVARRLYPSERGQAELVVDFGDGAELSVRQQTNQCFMVVLFTSVTKKRKALNATLGAEDGSALEKLFEGANKGARAVLPTEAIRATLTKYKDSTFWTMPHWFAEFMAQVAQDVFRLHVLTSASSETVSRALCVDRVTGHRNEGPNVKCDEIKTVIKVALHSASGGCICHLHQRTPQSPFRRMEMRLEMCGMPLVDGKCTRHSAEGEKLVQSAAFPGICAKAFRVEFCCTHVHEQGKMPCGVRVSLSNMFTDKHQLAIPLRAPILDLACCGASLMAKSAPTPATIADLRADANQTMSELTRLRAEDGPIGEEMVGRDAAAVWLLRKGGVTINVEGKFKGARVQPELHILKKTHGHLFRKVFVK